METRKLKLALSAGALALSLALAGCGGGGSSPQAANDPPQPMPVDTTGIATAAMVQAGSYMIEAGASATHGDVTYSCPVGGADCMVDVMADGTTMSTGGMATAMNSAGYDQRVALVAQINALRTQLGLDANADVGVTVAQLQTDLAALQKQVGDAADAAAMDAMKAAAAEAGALFAGIDVERTPGTIDLTVSENLMAVTDKHGGNAAIEEATTGTTFLTAAPTGAVIAVKATDTEVPSLGVWKGTELFGNTDGKMPSSTVVVYTDVEPNKSMPFSDVYTTASALDIDADASADAHVPLIMASDFDHTGEMDHAPKATSGDTITVRVAGTFHGAAGQYQCTAAAANECVSHEDDNGVRLTNGGSADWEFVPDPGAMVSVADGTYLYFGWWLHKDDMTPEVDAFHGVTGTPTPIVAADFTALSGTATYKGEAAGKYAIDPVAPGTYASGGHWTAKATLTADFGNETAAGTISGMIDNFMAGGEMMDWSVSLGETGLAAGGTNGAFASAGDGSTTADDDVVWTIGGEAAPESGSWSGNLHDQGKDNRPMGATGEFSATYSEDSHTIGHIVGAFGAHVE